MLLLAVWILGCFSQAPRKRQNDCISVFTVWIYGTKSGLAVLCLCRHLVLWTDLQRGLCMRRVLKCAFAYDRVWFMTRNARSGRTTSVRLTGDLGAQVGEAVACDLINRVKNSWPVMLNSSSENGTQPGICLHHEHAVLCDRHSQLADTKNAGRDSQRRGDTVCN